MYVCTYYQYSIFIHQIFKKVISLESKLLLLSCSAEIRKDILYIIHNIVINNQFYKTINKNNISLVRVCEVCSDLLTLGIAAGV